MLGELSTEAPHAHRGGWPIMKCLSERLARACAARQRGGKSSICLVCHAIEKIQIDKHP